MAGCVGDPAAPDRLARPPATPADGGAYPSGPYGQTVGAVIADACFTGVRRPPSVNYVAAGHAETICLHDFYNPGGSDPTKPKTLVILIAALWCGPCQLEAAAAAADHAYWAPRGVEFLSTVYEDGEQSPAGDAALDAWMLTYHLDHPTVLDPTAKLAAYFAPGSYPDNIVLDTTTMTFRYVDVGQQDFGPENPILRHAAGM